MTLRAGIFRDANGPYLAAALPGKVATSIDFRDLTFTSRFFPGHVFARGRHITQQQDYSTTVLFGKTFSRPPFGFHCFFVGGGTGWDSATQSVKELKYKWDQRFNESNNDAVISGNWIDFYPDRMIIRSDNLSGACSAVYVVMAED